MEPEVYGCEVDGSERLAAHKTVLQRKALIRDVFVEFHKVLMFLDRTHFSGTGQVIELGAGVYPVKESAPSVIATDVVSAPHLDFPLDACDLDLPDSSVRAFYLQNVFHHLPFPSRFFSELERTLVPGGGAIIIEPADGALASFLYPRLFASEGYDKAALSWEAEIGGPMSGANQALSYVIFDRDADRFTGEHPRLEIVHRDVLGNWVRYLMSGGLNFRPLLPAWSAGLLRGLEWLLKPARRWVGLHKVVVIRKRES
ncbi:MAG: class I SAM-dependent methyltransferase [Chloroflexota bacterium]|nr:class I SAM-dependent methyltransferase [Chloroflexota bacterium]